MFDRFLALLLILILSPLILLLLLITAFHFKCNPIYSQSRTTNGDRVFMFYKIRSMKLNSPHVPTGMLTNTENYISPWGDFLRKSSLDELLNMICVMKGDMNFIGPRPIMIEEIGLSELRKRNGVNCNPGITGLAQINGRDLIQITRKVACERYYNRNKNSIKLRTYIFYKTIIAVIKKSGITH